MNIWFWFKFLNFVNSLNFWGFSVKPSRHKNTKIYHKFLWGLFAKACSNVDLMEIPNLTLTLGVKFFIHHVQSQLNHLQSKLFDILQIHLSA